MPNPPDKPVMNDGGRGRQEDCSVVRVYARVRAAADLVGIYCIKYQHSDSRARLVLIRGVGEAGSGFGEGTMAIGKEPSTASRFPLNLPQTSLKLSWKQL